MAEVGAGWKDGTAGQASSAQGVCAGGGRRRIWATFAGCGRRIKGLRSHAWTNASTSWVGQMGKDKSAQIAVMSARRRNGYQCDANTSRRMRAVKTKATKPELIVRKLVASLGYKTMRNPEIPGRPDLAVKGSGKLIFVHGCFWHRHKNCRRATTPVRNRDLWNAKFDRTITRDRRNARALRAVGWDVLVLWECQLGNRRTMSRLKQFLERGPNVIVASRRPRGAVSPERSTSPRLRQSRKAVHSQ